ncbi:hypothetical protein PCC8801_3358 [Rippkaea orientalis PCC 8801]|uniref:DNA polymerase beta domain protein region n=1 Tax=Rippkaea orientalis (strain PCC 8801 / RF-1) TaxID=41431 RepID=B7JZB6_RIPO1|nr:nucleotidyltransferase domain-containing protein [Rippkaea orientalis]ACK67327.1 hypothetical protein PCC8801_3358 [Rippkaea orientalis PCC 8801]
MLSYPEISLIEKKQVALQIVLDCTELLKKQFGAKRVILFGSLTGQTPWHSRSDIDLAVEGLPKGIFFRAYAACRQLLPKGLNLDLDLIPLEDVYPEMRSRILEGIDMINSSIIALKSLIEDEFTALERIVKTTEESLKTINQCPSQLELNGFASYLHQYYTGIEKIFQRIAIHIDHYCPTGEHSHIDLLNQIASDIPEIRKAIITPEQAIILREYLAFRHFFRHAYGYQLRWSEMQIKLELMSDTLSQLHQQIINLLDNLTQEIP